MSPLTTSSHAGNADLALEPCLPSPGQDRFLSHNVRANRPIAIRGLVKDWPAVNRWTAQYLADFTRGRGDLQVPHRSTPKDLARMDLARIQQGRTSLHGLLSDCAADPDGDELYVPGMSLPASAAVTRDIEEPSLLSGLKTFGTTIFLGRNTRCIGHFHPMAQALLCQVQGVKRVWLFPPSQFGRLHLFPPWSESFYQSEVNFYGDVTPFPRLRRAKGIMYELHPGDALFIPLHWLHVPEGGGWTAAVTFWWRPGPVEWLRSAGSGRALVGIGAELMRRAVARFRPAP